MKKKSSISFGPGAASLILIFVMLTLSVLGMLSLMNSRNDMVLSERSAQVVQSVYELNARAEQDRQALDEVLYVLAQSAETDEEYTGALTAILAAANETEFGGEYETLMGLYNSVKRYSETDSAYLSAINAINALGESKQTYAEFASAIQALGEMELENGTVYWTRTDGLRTLDCAIEIKPLGSDVREQWAKYDLTAETAEAW